MVIHTKKVLWRLDLTKKNNSSEQGPAKSTSSTQMAKSDQFSQSLDAMLNVSTALEAMLKPIFDIDPGALADSQKLAFESDIEKFLNPHSVTDPISECSSNGDDIGSDCNTFAKMQRSQALAYSKTSEDTRIALTSAKSAWNKALLTFQEHLEIAQLDLELAECQAKAAFEAEYNKDSKARIEYLTANMKVAVITARKNNEASIVVAASTLSSAAATLINAYSAFLAETTNASLTALSGEAVAEKEFWQAVRTKRDSTA